jgi:nucleotide-binding universal stress UspA family protein
MKVIIGVDDSSFSDEAIRYACAATWPKGSRFLVISAVPMIVAGPGESITGEGYEALIEDQEKYLEGVAHRAEERLRGAGLDVQTLVVHGDPRTVLTDRARLEQADLIVVGSHGRSGLKKLLLGSVATHVVTHSHCPVLVVKAPNLVVPSLASQKPEEKKDLLPIV